MDRSLEFQAIMQIISNQDIQIKYAKENADNPKEEADKWTETHNTLVNSRDATRLLLNKAYCKQLHDLTEKPQENAVDEPNVKSNVESDNSEKVYEESAEVSVEKKLPCLVLKATE